MDGRLWLSVSSPALEHCRLHGMQETVASMGQGNGKEKTT